MNRLDLIETDGYLQHAHFNDLQKISGLKGEALNFFGKAIKVKDEATNEVFFIDKTEIITKLIGSGTSVSEKGTAIVERRILEIADSDSRLPASYKKLKELFILFTRDKMNNPSLIETEEGIIQELEKIKLEMSEIPVITYSNKISEIVPMLKPGDIIVRKYHEDNKNLICDLQKFFQKKGYREAYKCSHIAVYLGEIQGEHWIAEASMPHGHEAQIRRVKIDDPRFQSKHKNQYLVIRNVDTNVANELDRLAKNYSTKLLPEDERKPIESDLEGVFTYNYFEAVRSMWHSSKLGFYGKHRLFKYYADYKNGIAFEYLGQRRKFFCSHFALIMESLSEMNKSDKFKQLIAKHPIPKVYDQAKSGLELKVSKILYSLKKGVWSRWMAFRYSNEVAQSVSTHLDALRTAPQNAVNYMMDHKDKFTIVAIVNHKGDFPE